MKPVWWGGIPEWNASAVSWGLHWVYPAITALVLDGCLCKFFVLISWNCYTPLHCRTGRDAPLGLACFVLWYLCQCRETTKKESEGWVLFQRYVVLFPSNTQSAIVSCSNVQTWALHDLHNSAHLWRLFHCYIHMHWFVFCPTGWGDGIVWLKTYEEGLAKLENRQGSFY